MRAVVDTSVLVAAIRSRSGASFKLLSAIGYGLVTPIVSVPLMFEYEAVLKRPEHLEASGLSLADIDTIIDVVADRAKGVDPWFLWRPVLSDPADDMVLEAAMVGGAEAIVTHNIKDFEEGRRRFGVALMTPKDALSRLSRITQ